MSAESEAVSNSIAAEIQMAASRWVIDRQVREDWSTEDQTGLDKWLGESIANRIAYLRAEQAWSRTARAVALRQPTQAERRSSFASALLTWSKRALGAMAVAALAGAAAQYFLHATRYVSYSTPVGGRQVLTLSDGSQVELNTDSAVRIADSKTAPEVVVDKGEVYFDVKHDPSRHFSVLADGRRISDLGTKFLVREKTGHLEIALIEGRVLIGAPEGSNKPATDMEPGDIAVATPQSTVISKRAQDALSKELSWREGVLIFHHTTLADAAFEFNRYTGRKIVIADAKVAHMEINGTFRTNDVEMFTDVTADILGLHVEKLDDKILLGR
jgi:transmembrane sensor